MSIFAMIVSLLKYIHQDKYREFRFYVGIILFIVFVGAGLSLFYIFKYLLLGVKLL